MACAGTAQAETLFVTTDSGGIGGPDCTLRDAMTAAVTDTASGGCPAGSGDDTIELPEGATITLTVVDSDLYGPNGLPAFDEPGTLIVNGNGATIQRDSAAETPEFRFFAVGAVGFTTLILNDLTLTNGVGLDDGGAILGTSSFSRLIANNCTITNNTAEGSGGGIMYNGVVVLSNCTICGNTATEYGGGVYEYGQAPFPNEITDTTICDNSAAKGGGLLFGGSAAVLTHCTVSNNIATDEGGGIMFSSVPSSSSELNNCTINGNGASNEGGGLRIVGNPHTVLTHCTVSHNMAGSGGGISNDTTGALTLNHSIVANSLGAADCESAEAMIDGGYNLVEDGSCITNPTSSSGDPMLGPLQDNDGPTGTQAPMSGSPALDAVPPAECMLAQDQRGTVRPQGPGCDIGAYEAVVACGDGALADSEECDDGNTTSDDGCDSNCTITACGNHIVTGAEDCDDGGATENCDSDCTLVSCGDGTTNGPAGEACDDAGESATCDTDCTAAICGDGVMNATADEECDDGNTTDGDGCDANCSMESTPCAAAGDCADADANGVRDDNCMWSQCDGESCIDTPLTTFADMGGPFGTCEPDGFANIHDKNHALSCFSGVNTCDSINIDAGGPFGGCAADGFCNIHDANHALAAFAGTSTCACPAGPAPQLVTAPVGEATVRLWSSQHRITSGDEVEVEVFIDGPVGALRSYQLDLEVTGGRSGELELVDISVEARKDEVFARRRDVFDAVNRSTGQILSGLEADEGVPVRKTAYLATFTYRASSRAGGEFVIDLASETYLVAPGNGEITVLREKPVVVTVSGRR
jgi:cysteine-rich repeat protein